METITFTITKTEITVFLATVASLLAIFVLLIFAGVGWLFYRAHKRRQVILKEMARRQAAILAARERRGISFKQSKPAKP